MLLCFTPDLAGIAVSARYHGTSVQHFITIAVSLQYHTIRYHTDLPDALKFHGSHPLSRLVARMLCHAWPRSRSAHLRLSSCLNTTCSAVQHTHAEKHMLLTYAVRQYGVCNARC
jgi:hypothetical protein